MQFSLSSTFNHDIIVHRLHTRFGINGTALKWFSSGQNCRTIRVIVRTAISDTSPVHCGVPQGSVLGPVLFCMHKMPIEDIIIRQGLSYTMPDIQLYITCDGDQVPTGMIEECVGKIRHWMRTNMVALNDLSDYLSTKFYDQTMRSSCWWRQYNAVRNLGVMMVSARTTLNHV